MTPQTIMHVQTYAESIWGQEFQSAGALTHQQATSMIAASENDVADLIQRALVSYVDALQGTARQFYSWAIVKLYYSFFYAARARLLLARTAVVYSGRKPRLITIQTGALPSRVSGNTHEVVFNTYRRVLANTTIATSHIGADPAIEFLEEQRVRVNYRARRMCEPEPDSSLSWLQEGGIRQAITRWLPTSQGCLHLDAFAPERAMAALPLLLLAEVRDLPRQRAADWSEELVSFFRTQSRLSGNHCKPLFDFLTSF